MSEEDEKKGDRRWVASNLDQDFSKVEDTGKGRAIIIGYYTVLAPTKWLAFDADWNRIDVFPSQQDAKSAIIDNYKG